LCQPLHCNPNIYWHILCARNARRQTISESPEILRARQEREQPPWGMPSMCASHQATFMSAGANTCPASRTPAPDSGAFSSAFGVGLSWSPLFLTKGWTLPKAAPKTSVAYLTTL